MNQTRVCIVGVGLIGGSLGLALRGVRKGGKRRYSVWGMGRSKAELAKAKRRGAIDGFSTNAKEALKDADIVVFCVPVHKIVPIAKACLPYFKRGAVLTDVGSVKKSVVEEMSLAIWKRRDLRFVGAHPIAGSEKTGVENARKDLFKKATCVITNDSASFAGLDAVRSLWLSVGAHCMMMNAAEHDRWLSLTSHLPHLMAFALFSEVERSSRLTPVQKLVGGSFRDMTRIAGADPDLWTGVILQNRASIKRSVAAIQRQLRFFANASPARLNEALKRLHRAKAAW